jgi:pimeloyl-ACP methyl ester carboxylesterase
MNRLPRGLSVRSSCRTSRQAPARAPIRSSWPTSLRSVALAIGGAIVGVGCVASLDGFVWNGRHCSTVDSAGFDCTAKDMCSQCGAPLPFEKYGVPTGLAVQHPIPLDDGATNDAWFLPSDPTLGGPDRAQLTVVFSHGNFGGLEHYMNRAALLWKAGVNVFAVDYRGMGQSSDENEPSEQQFLADTAAAVRFLPTVLAAHGLPTDGKVIVAGYSAGALSAVAMATGDAAAPTCGLLLEAPWPSVQAFSDDSTFIDVPGSFLANGAWDNNTRLATYTGPYLQLHGTNDDTVRIALGRETFGNVASVDKELAVVEGAAHGNYLGERGDGNKKDVAAVLGEDGYLDLVGAFFDRLSCR